MEEGVAGKIVFEAFPKDSPLVINTIPYAVEKSQKDGEKDLVNLARELPMEGVWFYDLGDSIWYNLLKSNKKRIYKNGLFHIELRLRNLKLKELGDRFVNYHIHTKESVRLLFPLMEERFEEDIIEIVGKRRESIKKAISALSYISVILPSEDDLIVYTQLKETNKKVDLTAKIASPLGITSIGIEKLNERVTGRYELVRQEITNVSVVREGLDFIKNDKEFIIKNNYKRLLKEINKRMDGKMNLSFFPLDNSSLPLYPK